MNKKKYITQKEKNKDKLKAILSKIKKLNNEYRDAIKDSYLLDMEYIKANQPCKLGDMFKVRKKNENSTFTYGTCVNYEISDMDVIPTVSFLDKKGKPSFILVDNGKYEIEQLKESYEINELI